MAKVNKLTEKDLNRIVSKVIQEQEQTEIFGGIKDITTGLRGAFQGAGFDNSRLLSALSRTLQRLKKLDEPNTKLMDEMRALKGKVSTAKFGHQDQKRFLEDTIDRTILAFENYKNYVDQVESIVKGKIV